MKIFKTTVVNCRSIARENSCLLLYLYNFHNYHFLGFAKLCLSKYLAYADPHHCPKSSRFRPLKFLISDSPPAAANPTPHFQESRDTPSEKHSPSAADNPPSHPRTGCAAD